jgi:cytochrome c peroxidase
MVLAGCSDGEVSSETVELSAEQRALLATLTYDGEAPADPSNRFDQDAAAQRFGQRLFFDPNLSGPLIEGDHDGSAGTLGLVGEPGRVSCASCHVPEAGFVDVRSPHQQISLGAQWTARRTPTLLEVASAPLYNWDGRRDSLWGQAIGVMESEREFNSGRLLVAQQIFRRYRDEYEAIFGLLPPLDDAERFAELSPADAGCAERLTQQGPVFDCRGKPGDGADFDALAEIDQTSVTQVMVNAAKAISAYVRRLRCGPGRFETWLAGEREALSASEQRGAALFVGRAGCVGCHSGPLLSDGAFHNVGLSPAPVATAFVDTDDHGAALGIAALEDDPLATDGDFSDGPRDVVSVSPGPELEGAFRTPTLRCIADQPSFMHTGQLENLAQVVHFFARGGDPPGGYPGSSELGPLELSAADEADLVAFIAALQGAGPPPELLRAP